MKLVYLNQWIDLKSYNAICDLNISQLVNILWLYSAKSDPITKMFLSKLIKLSFTFFWHQRSTQPSSEKPQYICNFWNFYSLLRFNTSNTHIFGSLNKMPWKLSKVIVIHFIFLIGINKIVVILSLRTI